MAITTAGFDGTVNEAEWSKIQYGMGYGSAPSVVVSGLAVSVGAGTRAVAVSAGSAVVAGVLVESSAIETRSATANATGAVRRDYLILKLVWATNTATIEIKPGTASLPSLTQTPGVTWEMPLAQVTVANGATTIPADQIIDRHPRPARINVGSDSVAPIATILASSTGRTVATVTMSDPGWSYLLDVSARVRSRLNSGTGGALTITAYADGVLIGEFYSDRFPGVGDGTAANLDDVSSVKSGATVVTLVASPLGLATGSSLEILSGKLVVRQIPV